MAFGHRARRPRTRPPADTPSAPMSRSDCGSRTGRMAWRRRREAAIGRKSTTGRRAPAARWPRVPRRGRRARRDGRSAATCRARRPFSPSRTPRARSSRAPTHTRWKRAIPRGAATRPRQAAPGTGPSGIHRHEGRWPPAAQAAAERAARLPRATEASSRPSSARVSCDVAGARTGDDREQRGRGHQWRARPHVHASDGEDRPDDHRAEKPYGMRFPARIRPRAA